MIQDILQWGHNFFVMEIRVFGFSEIDISSLQWGHNFFVMEISPTSDLVKNASGSFNGAITFSLWKYPLAHPTSSHIGALQWGHNFFVMEIAIKNSKYPSFSMYLQWGHNFFVMEISVWILRVGIDYMTFNGAITFSLWKSY